MKLWTFHKPDFSITSGDVDHAKSGYIECVPGLQVAYEELARRLGLPKYKIVWCHVREDFTREGYEGHVEYQLDVPDDEILAITDTFIWNKILGLRTYPESLRREARMKALDNIPPIWDFVSQQIEQYHQQQPPEGGWWSKLFIADLEAEGATVLLRHPIPASWIVKQVEPPRI